MNHTKEPWSIKQSPSNSNYFVYAEGRKEALGGVRMVNEEMDKDEGIANASRIVACVNACAGMDDPEKYIRELESGSKMHFDQAMRNGQAAGNLLGALKGVTRILEAFSYTTALSQNQKDRLTDAKQVIAKAEAV